MKKTAFLFLACLLLIWPAACMADFAQTAWYTDGRTGKQLEYPFKSINYDLMEDGTALLWSITLKDTAPAEMEGACYLPSMVDDHTVTAFDGMLLETMETDGFDRIVFPESIRSYRPIDGDSSGAFLIRGGIREVVFAGADSPFSVTDDGCFLEENRPIGFLSDEEQTELTIPEGVQTVDLSVIAEAYPKLAVLRLPASLAGVERTANWYPAALETIEVHGDNPVFYAQDGVLFRDKELILVPAEYQAAVYTVPEGITSIASCAFSSCDNLQEVILPESMQQLEPNAFYSCQGLRRINLPAGLTQIGEGVFSFCWLLNSVTLDPANTAFSLQDGLLVENTQNMLLAAVGNGRARIVLPESIRAIGAYAFTSHDTMNEVVLNEGLESIGDEAFRYTYLTEIRLPTTLKIVSAGAFADCEGLRRLAFAGSAAALESMGECAFYATALTEVHFPEDCGLRSLGVGLFGNCGKLTEVTLPRGLEEIGDFAFDGCGRLKRIDLPETIRTLGGGCFTSCSSLRSLMLPEKLEELDLSAVDGCQGLEYLLIPQNASIPWTLPEMLMTPNSSGHGRIVVHRDSAAHKECRKREIPCTLLDELPFRLGPLRVTSASDEQLQHFLENGGTMTCEYSGEELIITTQTEQGEADVRRIPCGLEDGKLVLEEGGYMMYRFQDVRHVELIAQMWTMQLEGQEMP